MPSPADQPPAEQLELPTPASGHPLPGPMKFPLTSEQRAIVEYGDGPLVVIAGAGTGKTRVIVERVRWLLETKKDLLPEKLLVLTYNVKAAQELQQRIEELVGATARARMTVSNFHSFCHSVLSESAGEADMPPHPDVLDGIGQYLLIRDLRPELGLVYHQSVYTFPELVKFINRAKDELVTPDAFDAYVAGERQAFEDRFGSYPAAVARVMAQGKQQGPSEARKAYARLRQEERADERGEEANPEKRKDELEKVADREARRTVGGTGKAWLRSHFLPDQLVQVDTLADTYVADGAALEVLRLEEIGRVYRAYQEELHKRGALDFGEQISAVTELFKRRPNILRRWQRQYRYILVDEFQDVNIAQIELIELLGRTPDRPDNVMVVGDDDQSIYRFRGASFAAFAEFDRRFSRPPTHDPNATPPGPPPRLRIEQNFRSVRHILTAADGLIERNQLRFLPDKHLRTDRDEGRQVELVVCGGPEDEAVAIVDAIRARLAEDAAANGGGSDRPARPNWSDAAVLYRKHKHRDAIVERLREEDIPYTVVGGLSLFAAPEIRDLEQGMRAIANPMDNVALTRLMTAGPWRLDALEVLRVTSIAGFDKSSVVDVAHRLVEQAGQTDAADGAGKAKAPDAPDPVLVAKLRRMLDAMDELHPLTFRDGPHTIVMRFLEKTGQVLDLVAAGTTEAQRKVVNIASFVRFAADWQEAHPQGTLSGFVDYLDAYQSAGGELPTSVELSEDVQGVRLMTLYQAKGLEFPHVFIPFLLENEWPTREGWTGYFPPELLREHVAEEGIHEEEERRLLYVAMTRAQESLMLSTHSGQPGILKAVSHFFNELCDGEHPEVALIDRTSSWALPEPGEDANGAGADAAAADADAGDTSGVLALARRVMPMPTSRERRLALRLRATELIGLMEVTNQADPETAVARAGLGRQLAALGESAAMRADEARAAGLDPLTFVEVAQDSGTGANLLQVVPLPDRFSYSAFSTYETCPLQYAFGYVYRIPEAPEVRPALTFGSTAHAAFEAFTKERRDRVARGEPAPTREDLERLFRQEWRPMAFGERTTEEAYRRRIGQLLDNFWEGEVSHLGEAIREEEKFELAIEDPAGGPAVIVTGSIDRIDRLPSGGIEVIDYKTGSPNSQKSVETSLQLTIYALACRDSLQLGTPERVTLYFTESSTRMSTTRTDEQLDAARTEILERARQIRSGDFAATPSDKACRYCNYARLCPSKV